MPGRPVVELVYADDCPNVDAARNVLLRAFFRVGLDPHWREWRADDSRRPSRLNGFGSPTILVAGRDVAGDAAPAAADCCRVYEHAGRLAGVPTVEQIATALLKRDENGNAAENVPSQPSSNEYDIAEGDMNTACLRIEGMHCNGCADTIQALLSKEPGVKSASVSYEAREGRVLYDPAATQVRRLIEALERAGYRASDSDQSPNR